MLRKITSRRSIATLALAGWVLMAQAAHAQEMFTIAGDRNGEPLEFIDEAGEFSGPLVDTMRAVFDRLGLAFSHEPFEWSAAQQRVRDGEADALITVMTPERAEYLVSNEVPLAELNWVAVVRGDHPQRDELLAKTRLEDFAGYAVLDYAGNGWGIANLGGLDVTREGTVADTLLRLATGTGDVLINFEQGTKQTVAGLLLSDPEDAEALQGLVTGSNVLGVIEFNLLIRQDSPYVALIPQIDAALRELADEPQAASGVGGDPRLLLLALPIAFVVLRSVSRRRDRTPSAA